MANGNNKGAGAAIGAAAGIGAALAAAAGAYWLYGTKDAAKHRRMARSWMLKARADVMDRVEQLQNLDKKQYMAIVDTVVKGTAAAAAATRPEIALLTRDLKSAWSQMASQMKKPVGKSARTSKKRPAKKSAKKKSSKKSK